MKWADFKKKVEDAGITDDSQIWYIHAVDVNQLDIRKRGGAFDDWVIADGRAGATKENAVKGVSER